MKRSLLNRKTASVGTAVATASTYLAAVPVRAQEGGVGGGIDAANTGENPADLDSVIQNVISILLFIVGAGAVIMLIIGGIRYVVSAGDQQAVANAKNTILYAIVGVIVAVLAWVAVQFVFDQLTN